MKQAIRFAGIALALICLLGCIQVDTVVKVKPDGSGMVEETLLVTKASMQEIKKMMQGMAQQMEGMQPGGGQLSDDFTLLDEAKLREKAKNMGEGVMYVFAEEIATREAEGYRAVFAFADINKLRLSTSPSDKAPAPSGVGKAPEGKKAPATFHFVQGDPAILRVMLPKEMTGENLQPPEFPGTQKTDDPQAAMMLDTMKRMFQDMKVSITLEVQGDIVQTNATHRKDSRITLMEVDFGKLLDDEKNLKKLTEQRPENPEEAKKLLKDIPGIKVELNPELRIEFAGVEPTNSTYWLEKGAIFYTYGNPKAAIKSYKKAIELDPQSATAHFGLGICYGDMGQYKEAISSISKAIEIQPEKGSYFYGRGWIYLLSGDKDKAMEDFRRAAALGDDDAKAYLEDTSDSS